MAFDEQGQAASFDEKVQHHTTLRHG